MISLERDGVACTLDPELGGSLLSLSVDGFDLLRPAPSVARDVLEAACFPLVPFANRIDNGRMKVRERRVVLPPDPAAPPHAHHGHGWRSPWRLAERGQGTAELTLRHEPDEWPWAYVATQRVTLLDGGVEVDLSIRNLSDEDMPAGLGLHPYFVRQEADTFETEACRMLMSGGDGIPTDEAPFAPGQKPLAALDGLDNFLPDDSGRVRLRLGDKGCEMRARGAVGFHVYVPEGANFFCVEPVSHRPNAFAADAEEHLIGPNETRGLAMRLTVL